MSGRTNLASAFYYDPENTYQKATLAHLYRNSSLIKVASLISVPPPEVRVYLRDLASTANSTANENSCGSVLVGQGSDTDEFGDICFWLGNGPYGEGHEANVLRALNLYHSTPRARRRPHFTSFLDAHLLADNFGPIAAIYVTPTVFQAPARERVHQAVRSLGQTTRQILLLCEQRLACQWHHCAFSRRSSSRREFIRLGRAGRYWHDARMSLSIIVLCPMLYWSLSVSHFTECQLGVSCMGSSYSEREVVRDWFARSTLTEPLKLRTLDYSNTRMLTSRFSNSRTCFLRTAANCAVCRALPSHLSPPVRDSFRVVPPSHDLLPCLPLVLHLCHRLAPKTYCLPNLLAQYTPLSIVRQLRRQS